MEKRTFHQNNKIRTQKQNSLNFHENFSEQVKILLTNTVHVHLYKMIMYHNLAKFEDGILKGTQKKFPLQIF